MAEIIDEDGHKYSYKVIVIEGPDGVGKTTFSANFAARLRRHDRSKYIGQSKDLHEQDNRFIADVCVSGRKLAVMRGWDMYSTMGRGQWFMVLKTEQNRQKGRVFGAFVRVLTLKIMARDVWLKVGWGY